MSRAPSIAPQAAKNSLEGNQIASCRRLNGEASIWSQTHGGLIMFGEPWGYGDYGQFHMVVWIILAAAFAAGVVWRLRSGSSS